MNFKRRFNIIVWRTEKKMGWGGAKMTQLFTLSSRLCGQRSMCNAGDDMTQFSIGIGRNSHHGVILRSTACLFLRFNAADILQNYLFTSIALLIPTTTVSNAGCRHTTSTRAFRLADRLTDRCILLQLQILESTCLHFNYLIDLECAINLMTSRAERSQFAKRLATPLVF